MPDGTVNLGPLPGETSRMKTPAKLYRGHRFPTEIISHGVWLYYRFSLSLRDVEGILASGESSSHTRPSDSGVGNSDLSMPGSSSVVRDGSAIFGTWMKSS